MFPMKPPSPPTDELPTREGYDRWSEFYDDYANPLIELETPVVRRMLGEVDGLDVLDVGCGTGRHAIWMSEAGANVTAIDFSAGMLEQAQDKQCSGSLHFLRHDLHDPLPFDGASFDCLLHCLVLDHLQDPGAIIAEFARVLRPAGRAVISVLHPAMYLKGTQARFVHPESGELVLIKNEQYSIPDYIMAVKAAGLELELIEQGSGNAELAKRIPRAEKYIGWPMLLAFALRR
jgi:SAM-dependent methyltransferase